MRKKAWHSPILQSLSRHPPAPHSTTNSPPRLAAASAVCSGAIDSSSISSHCTHKKTSHLHQYPHLQSFHIYTNSPKTIHICIDGLPEFLREFCSPRRPRVISSSSPPLLPLQIRAPAPPGIVNEALQGRRCSCRSAEQREAWPRRRRSREVGEGDRTAARGEGATYPTGTRPRYRVCSTHGPFSGARPQCALYNPPAPPRSASASVAGRLPGAAGGVGAGIWSGFPSAAIPGRLVCCCSDLCGRKDFYLFVGGSSSRTNFFMYVVWRFPFSKCSDFSVLHAGFVGF